MLQTKKQRDGMSPLFRSVTMAFVCIALISWKMSVAAPSAELIDGARVSVAFVSVSYKGPGSTERMCSSSQGSAFLISNNGHALTAAHVLERPSGCPDTATQMVEGRTGYSRTGEWIPIDVLSIDRQSDVALIQFAERQNGYQSIAFCNLSELDRQEYTGVGFPEGHDYGNVTLRYQNRANGVWVMAGPRVPGMSGGPVIEAMGRVIGIIKGSRARGSDTGKLVIPLSLASPLIAQAGLTLEQCNDLPTPALMTQIVEDWSKWKKGGYNQDAWCNDLRSNFETSLGRSVEWQVLDKHEKSKEEPFRRFFYMYYCKAEAKWLE